MIDYVCFKIYKLYPSDNPVGVFWKSTSYPSGLGEAIVSVIHNIRWIVIHIRDSRIALIDLSMVTEMFNICTVQYDNHILKC